MEEIKTISELIKHLETIRDENGDIAVCYSSDDEYWGSVQDYLTIGYNLKISDHAQPEGPKSGKSNKALVFGNI